MIDFQYRISCIIAVPSEDLLDHAFHYESRDSLNETMNSPGIAKSLAGGVSIRELFAPQIAGYISEYGLQLDQIMIERYAVSSGHADITASFFKDGNEDRLETRDGSMTVVAYYHVNQNLGYGLELYEYISKLPNNKFALRVGEQVPTGDVNLAYVHTPRIDVNENLSMIDTASVNENVIPMDQIESIVVPDGSGVLHYADILSDQDPIVLRPPYNRFPSKNVNITRRFMRNENTVSSALFYKFELKYHYDSDAGEPGKAVRYKGNQIQLTDENGNLLGPEFKYLIYAQATSINPKIYWIKIYMQMNTDEERTFKVRYNHVEEALADNELRSAKKTIELYSNKGNIGMIEGGKLRIINGMGAYVATTPGGLQSADDTQEVYAIEEYGDKDGYKIMVPQRSMNDPRPRSPFNYKLSATFKDDSGSNRTLTFGYVTDWVINPDALLAHEKLEYTGEHKALGIKTGNGFFSARSLIQMIMPLDMVSLPVDAVFEIHDAAGDLLYTTTSAADNSSIATQTNSSGSEPPKAKSNTASPAWNGASGSNVRIKNNAIEHIATIFPERQRSTMDFTWEASGGGETSSTLSYKGRWKVCQQLTVEKKFTTKPIDVFTGWNQIGTEETRSSWKYDKAKDVLLLSKNAVEVSGYYNGSHKDKQNYIFSACVQVNDDNDDDVIGIMFRVNSDHEYYTFLWEKEELMRVPGANGNGVGRIMVEDRGVSAVLYYTNPDPSKFNSNYEHETNMTKYMNDYGFKQRKKGIYKASPTTYPPYSDALHPNCQYKSDKTGNSFRNITSSANYNPKGWVKGETYKIRVVVADNKFQVYIGNDTSDDATGTLVCQAQDDSISKGSYGICNISQENAYWSKLRFTELDVKEICTDWTDITLSSNDWVQVSPIKPASIIKPKIDEYMKETYGKDMPYTAMPIEAIGDPADLRIEVRNDGFVWAVTSSYEAGGAITTPWTTHDNQKNIKGTGKATLRADGVLSIQLTPNILSRDGIPGDVNGFAWKDIWVTGGDTARLRINRDDTITAEMDTPPITPIGTPLTWPQEATDKIYKHEGIKSLAPLFGSGGIMEKLNIPGDIPKSEILLRIERGDAGGQNKEHRVNYRWRYQLKDREYFEVDQANGGVNRMRLKNILKAGTANVIDSLTADLVAWTTFEELESVAILAIRIDDDRKIEIEKPKVEQSDVEIDNWYVRVKNGRVKKRLVLPFYEPAEKIPQLYAAYPELAVYAPRTPDQRTEVILDYTVPEYPNQEFYSRPSVLVEREKPVILNEKMIQTRYAPIALKSEKGISYLEVEALRMNQSRKLRVMDVDAKKGIIYLYDKIRDQDEIIVRYAYQEDWYTYRGFNRSREFFHMDFNPSPGHRFTLAKDGLHEWVPGDIPTRESYTITERPSNQLLVRQMHVYLRPTSIWIQEEAGARLIEGTTRSQAIYHTDEGNWFDPADYNYDPTMLRLGKFTVQPNSDIKKDMIILDTRSRGGGLDEAISREVIRKVNKESMHHWDIGYFDGEAYQENGVMIIRLPRSILKTPANPTGFSEAEVQAALAKHKAYGNLPIIEYYDAETMDYNIIGNAEFLNGKHVEQFRSELSSGAYFINEENQGTGDNSLLQIMGDSIYGILIPGSKLQHSAYTLDIKAKKLPGAADRSAGRIKLNYEGSVIEIQMDPINSEEWMIYKADIPAAEALLSIIVEVNKDEAQTAVGNILIDYVKMFPKFTANENMEIIEI